MATNLNEAVIEVIESDDCILQSDEKAEIKEALSKPKEIRIIVSGKTGAGKSTLLNGFVGTEVFKPGDDLEPETKVVSHSKTTINGTSVTAFDCPGLQDGTDNENKYLQDLLKQTGGKFDLMLYCIAMTEVRSDLLVHNSAIKQITEKMGKDIWKNAFIALTFANVFQKRLISAGTNEDEIEKKFNAKVAEWKGKVHAALLDAGVDKEVADSLPVHPAGHYNVRSLPGRSFWFSEIWANILIATKPEAQIVPILIRGKESAFKTVEEVTPEDFKKPISQQPVIITPEVEKVVESTGIGKVIAAKAKAGATYGAAVGLSVCGVVGAAAGAAVGGIVGAVTGLIVGIFRRNKSKKK